MNIEKMYISIHKLYILMNFLIPELGVLCGQCRNDEFGVSALLNKCVSCHDASGTLIAGLSKLT